MRRASIVTTVAVLVTVGLSGCMQTQPPPGDGDGNGADEVVVVEMTDGLDFSPETITVTVGTTVKWVNVGSIPHTVTPDGDEDAWPGSPEGSGDATEEWLREGESWSYTFTETGTYSYHCIPHASEGSDGTMQGMVGTVIVTESGDGGDGDGDSYEFGAPKTADIAEVSRHPSEMPSDTEWTLYENGSYSKRVARDGPVDHEVHFQIQEGVAEVLPGTTIDAWTFDSAIPGPMIRVRENDTVDFFLHNPADSALPHNVDFHAVTGPGGGAVTLDTAPGATSHLQVKMLNPGIYIYHCAWPDIPSHISHGMYGLIVVEPEEGLPEVDHEYYMMQSEFYTEAGGERGTDSLEGVGHLDYDGSMGNLEEPTFVVWNGRPGSILGDRALGSYGDNVTVNETVRMFTGNIGPNLISSFHVIGEIFDRVYVEGSFDLVNRNVQTTLVPSGGAVGVEFRVEVPGTYIPLDHAIYRVHKGMIGQLTVDGPPNADVYEPVRYSDELR